MAYISQEDKKELTPAIKAVLKRYNVKATIAVRNYSTLVVNIKEGCIDFAKDATHTTQIGGFMPEVNEYHLDKHWSGDALDFLQQLLDAMQGPSYFDNDDAMTDYFHRSHYTDINIGKWDKEYKCLAVRPHYWGAA